MSVVNGKIAVGTAATAIPVSSVMPYVLHVHNDDNTNTVYLGGPDVTTANGMLVGRRESLQMMMGPADRLYAVSSNTGHDVSWLAVLKDI